MSRWAGYASRTRDMSNIFRICVKKLLGERSFGEEETVDSRMILRIKIDRLPLAYFGINGNINIFLGLLLKDYME
jgi:hypothetical protein